MYVCKYIYIYIWIQYLSLYVIYIYIYMLQALSVTDLDRRMASADLYLSVEIRSASMRDSPRTA